MKVFLNGNYDDEILKELKLNFEKVDNVKYYGKKDLEKLYIVIEVSYSDYMLLDDDLISYLYDLKYNNVICNFRVDLE